MAGEKQAAAISYAAWRFTIYMEHGRLTYREIDDACAAGVLKLGMTIEQVRAALHGAGGE